MPFFFVYNHIPKIIIPDVASNGIFELFKKTKYAILSTKKSLKLVVIDLEKMNKLDDVS